MLSPEEIRKFPWEELDWLIVNEGELAQIGEYLSEANDVGKGKHNTVSADDESASKDQIISSARSTIQSVLSQFGTSSKTGIICTIGPHGVLYTSPSSTTKTKTINHLPAAELKNPLKDTTGAGDCFAGTFVAGLMRLEKDGKELEDGLEEVVKRCLIVSEV